MNIAKKALISITNKIEEDNKKLDYMLKSPYRTFTGFSGAEMYTSTGNQIQAVSFYKEANKAGYMTGIIVFSTIINQSKKFDVIIKYENEYGNKYIATLKNAYLYNCRDDRRIYEDERISNEEAYTIVYSNILEEIE